MKSKKIGTWSSLFIAHNSFIDAETSTTKQLIIKQITVEMTQQEITAQLEQRRRLVQSNPEKADTIQDNIMQTIMDQFDNYPVDFIIETLTKLGDAPQIVYDDNGLFAVSSEGMNPVVYGKDRIEGSMVTFVEKDFWENSIRLALWNYLCRV
jgi:23S rRNA-/tRNA-specific pseudouridylate synthase